MFAYLRRDEPVLIWTGKAMLDGVLTVPQNPAGLVILLGLGGTFRYDRIRSVAHQFQEEGFATLIADLLTADEQQFDERTGHFRTDTTFLASRVREIVQWAATEDATEGMPIALFAGTAAAAACVEAADGLSVFAISLIGPKFEAIRDRITTLETPTLLVFDHPPSLPTLADLASGRVVSSVMTVPGISSLLENDLAAGVAARESLKWFFEHAPALTVV